MSVQVDEESRISFFDGNQGPKQCESQVEITPDVRYRATVPLEAQSFNCVRPYGHEGLHESHDGDTCWRDIAIKEIFKKIQTIREIE